MNISNSTHTLRRQILRKTIRRFNEDRAQSTFLAARQVSVMSPGQNTLRDQTAEGRTWVRPSAPSFLCALRASVVKLGVPWFIAFAVAVHGIIIWLLFVIFQQLCF